MNSKQLLMRWQQDYDVSFIIMIVYTLCMYTLMAVGNVLHLFNVNVLATQNKDAGVEERKKENR